MIDDEEQPRDHYQSTLHIQLICMRASNALTCLTNYTNIYIAPLIQSNRFIVKSSYQLRTIRVHIHVLLHYYILTNVHHYYIAYILYVCQLDDHVRNVTL